MSKRKKRGAEPARRSESAPGLPPASATAAILTTTPGSGATSRGPTRQRLYDLPYSAQVPSPVRPELGLASLVARAGHNAGYSIDLTLLDAADHRLIRTGVLLAHRVLDGQGEWYLGAPDWAPLLPEERIVPMRQADLPADLAELVRPFRRGALLTPVAALHCERREFALRDASAQIVALLRDDKVTVRRNGLTTARYREVILTPSGSGLDQKQTEWLSQCFGHAGATELERLPRLVRRLGAPATGPSDLPGPGPLLGGTFGQYLTQVIGGGARDLIREDLALINGLSGAETRLVETGFRLRTQIDGLRDVFDREWVEDVIEDLDWLTSPPTTGGYRARLHSQRYLALLDRLIAAARAPKTSVNAADPAGTTIDTLYRSALTRFTSAANRLGSGGALTLWSGASAAAQDLSRIGAVRAVVRPTETAADQQRLAPALELLAQVQRANRRAESIRESIEQLSPQDAFDAGRQFESDATTSEAVRSKFVSRWPKIRKKLG
ncbi:MAG: hypothetical protein L0H41_10810 [Microlunatus sp.]|nr:hypothetical protein [Microlunatus sp.]MDN5771339.1 hypothetical protein [Microlunatus sp.]